jgi:hypothetical protein
MSYDGDAEDVRRARDGLMALTNGGLMTASAARRLGLVGGNPRACSEGWMDSRAAQRARLGLSRQFAG